MSRRTSPWALAFTLSALLWAAIYAAATAIIGAIA